MRPRPPKAPPPLVLDHEVAFCFKNSFVNQYQKMTPRTLRRDKSDDEVGESLFEGFEDFSWRLPPTLSTHGRIDDDDDDYDDDINLRPRDLPKGIRTC
jgi:hypothetical protein